MATSTRTASQPTEDESLEQAIEQARAHVKALEAKLAPRRAAEAAELDDLVRQLTTLTQTLETQKRALGESTQRQAALRNRLEDLGVGFDRATRWWVQLLEPTMGAVALLIAPVMVGISGHDALRTLGLEVLGFTAGTTLVLGWRRRSKAR